jgi:hypothetical protein
MVGQRFPLSTRHSPPMAPIVIVTVIYFDFDFIGPRYLGHLWSFARRLKFCAGVSYVHMYDIHNKSNNEIDVPRGSVMAVSMVADPTPLQFH